MYLKSIEVHGFKSFANKIVFEFHNGITGIVGPNGSGKSNVADAVRWVLGEQSAKQLRGARMEDVIFSGTEARKAMGYAYVAITINNEDHKLSIEYDEVTVARRVYRSGESEYLINGNSCRLRDVQELFLDTGIGKEGYSIIGQGQIEKILSGKPEDRRELFDEAAGIVKFKKRKAAAERNLEEEKQNLHRINDILREIEKQIGPLEQQSKVARDYLKLRDELRILDVNLFLLENEKVQELKLQLEEKLKIAQESLSVSNLNYESIKVEFEKLEVQIEQCNEALETNKVSLNEFKLRKEKKEGEIKVLREQISSVEQNDKHYQSRLQNIDEELNGKNGELESFVKIKKEVDEKLDSLDDAQTGINSELEGVRNDIAEYSKQIENCNSEIYKYLSDNSSLKTNLQRYETILEQNNIKKVELNQKLLRNKSEEAFIDIAIQEQEEKLAVISGQIKDVSEDNQQLENTISASQQKLEQISAEITQKQQQYHIEHSKLESLKNLTERYEGYGNSIRKIMERKETQTGIVGVVADIIKTESKYETAIETALGGNIQNIVTDNEETAKRLIEYLKRDKLGRATFLPLTSISGKEGGRQEKLLTEKGVLGYANQLVQTEENFRELMMYLLGRSLVVDTIENALLLARKYNYSLRIVTLDGELLNPGGSLSGGAYKNNSNLLGRRREIEELERKVSKLQAALNTLDVDKEQQKKDRSEAREALEKNKTVLHETYLTQNTIKMSLSQEEKKKKDGRLIYEEITKEIKEIERQSIELNDNIDRLKLELKSNEEKSKENEHRIEVINELLNTKKQDELKISEKVSNIRIDFSALEQKNQNVLENIRRIKKDLEKLYEEKNQLNKNILNAAEQIREKCTGIEKTETEIKDLNIRLTELESAIQRTNETREKIGSEHKSFFGRREELSREINELDKEVFRLSNQLEKIAEQVDERLNYMWEEYELTYHTALEYKAEAMDNLNQMKKDIQEVKTAIKALGDVNVNAIDDFKNLSERYIFLKTQRDDLEKAEETLLEIIAELDIEMRKQFEDKFKLIKEQFDVVFKELFGGGKATLELTEEADILEAGIIITSQPPGKKLQNMMQLSGGEKALTAISLLFAIQNLKPSPFCLLDEIEAALDDSNVKRFAKYLHKLTKDTQFIIITHRRGTMNAADILYGITMQEKGVSTLVSVNLIENDLEK
jgi:chromosome segregation protein